MRIGLTTSIATAIAIGVLIASGGGGAAACALPNYPTAACTGYPVGQSLTSSGGITISTNNATYDGYHFSDGVVIAATGVTIKNSWVDVPSGTNFAIEVNNGASVTIQDTEVDCQNFSSSKGVFANFSAVSTTVIRANIHGCEDGVYVTNDLTLQDSYIHDMATGGPNPDPHNDGVQSDGASDLTITHNRIQAVDTSALGLNNDAGETVPIHDSLVKDNLLSGGGWTLYCPIIATTNFVIQGNHWINNSWAFGPNTDCSGETDGGGNQIQETGTPVSLNT